MDLQSSYVLLFFVLILTLAEKNYLNNIFTPFTVTAWPFVIISISVNLFAVRLDFLPVTARANYFILLNLFVIWLVGFLMFFSQQNSLKKQDYMAAFSKYKGFRYFLLFLAWVVIVAVYFKIASILGKEGWQYVGTDEFEQEMTSGPVAHLIQLGKVLLILLALVLWNSKKSWIDYLTMALLGVSIISLMVKYHIMWVVLIIFFIRNLNITARLQFRKIAYIALTVMILFVVNYLVLIYSWGTLSINDSETWEFIFGWFFNYLMSGPILLDRWLELAYSKPWWSLFIVPINLTNAIIGNPERLNAVKYVSAGFTNVSPDFSSNVATSYGVYYLIGGIAFTLFVTIIFSIFSYLFYFKSLKTNNTVIIFISAIFLTMGTLSFFGQWITLLSSYEIVLFFIILIGLFKVILELKAARKITI